MYQNSWKRFYSNITSTKYIIFIYFWLLSIVAFWMYLLNYSDKSFVIQSYTMFILYSSILGIYLLFKKK